MTVFDRGETEMEKVVTTKVTVVECVEWIKLPLVPVMVTV